MAKNTAGNIAKWGCLSLVGLVGVCVAIWVATLFSPDRELDTAVGFLVVLSLCTVIGLGIAFIGKKWQSK